MKWALVLSGGGSKGAAHIGVIQALEEAKLRPSMVIGVSAGSFVASLYGTGYSSSEMLSITRKYHDHFLFDFDWRWAWHALLGLFYKICGKPSLSLWPRIPNGILRGRQFERLLERIWDQQCLDGTSPPVVITATDLVTGSSICFLPKGLSPLRPLPYRRFLYDVPIARAVRSSCGVPGVFQPLYMDSMALVDGAVRSNLPADIAQALGAEKVICVNLRNPDLPGHSTKNLIETMLRSLDILGYETDLRTLQEGADLVLEPSVTMSVFDFSQIDGAVQSGYKTTLSALPEIRRILESPKKKIVEKERPLSSNHLQAQIPSKPQIRFNGRKKPLA
ncbi:patatin-like phospholipase family protein [Heliorestis convoluta]|uniref:Patatin-like phospholipase family protein n=1 Tax=Heliorestis convoluta TaxID=356322 RepID=A0A5Q2MZ13_9FIRM|nr:patatin-like phospholipase family protein [Heliorestis convoluta]QGG46659.1 patatin-like phospholipase family protein [Heliorestis convoluta]